jgi:glucose/arabinose dehydrogenase
LFSDSLLSLTDKVLQARIRDAHGIKAGPDIKDLYSEGQIFQIATYLRLQKANLSGRPPFIADPEGQVLKTRKQTVKIAVVARGLDTPWAMAFLPDGQLLVTERGGRLRTISRDGVLAPEPVKGMPKPWVRQDAGYMDVAVHPDYLRNGWVYLSYAEVLAGAEIPPPPPPGSPANRAPSPPTMTVLIRGRIKNNTWIDSQVIYRAPPAAYSAVNVHYGSRFLFDGRGHVFFSLGERGDMRNAQNLSSPLGKIHRINEDGSIPPDNPFTKTPGAIASIWSYGHRNPQGMALDPVSGLMWEAEHGPTGGDEINIIRKGHNYGWGVVSMGIQPGIEKTSEPGMDSPVAYFTPTLAPSGINFDLNRASPWRNDLLVAALLGQELLRLEVRNGKITEREVLFNQFGRVRTVANGPDGRLFVLIQNPTGAGTGLSLSAPTPGMLIRLDPVKGQ